MRVVQATRFGGPEVLVTVGAADPVAGPGEVVVDVTAADTLFVETQIRRGWGGEFFTVKPPYVPGGAVSGRVHSVGPAVDERWVGRRVAAHTGVTAAAGTPSRSWWPRSGSSLSPTNWAISKQSP